MSDNSNIALQSDEQKVSYGFGLQFGQQLLRNQFEGLDADIVASGMKDILQQNAIQLDEQALNAAFASIQEKMQAEQAEKAKQMAELGQSFLEENAKREGVTVTDSGLQFEVLEQGAGDKPSKDATVRVHYHGTFMNGQVFDSSVERDQPAEFGVTQVIAGWTEALQLMPVGAKYRLVIPSNLAYGDAGAPPSIPGGAVLVFEVHLLDII